MTDLERLLTNNQREALAAIRAFTPREGGYFYLSEVGVHPSAAVALYRKGCLVRKPTGDTNVYALAPGHR